MSEKEKKEYFQEDDLDDIQPELAKKVSVSWTVIPTKVTELKAILGMLNKKADQLRSEGPVNWSAYKDEDSFTEEICEFLSSYQKTHTKENRDKLLGFFESHSLSTLAHVVKEVCRKEDVRKFLVIIDDVIWEDISRFKLITSQDTQPWKEFFDFSSSDDEFVQNIAIRIVAKMITKGGGKPEESDLLFCLKWMRNNLNVRNQYFLSVIHCIQMLMGINDYRLPFLRIDGIYRIVQLLSDGVRFQAQYQLIFCLWLASFHPLVNEEMSSSSYQTIPVMNDILEESPIEILKLPRVIMATFRNMLEVPKEEVRDRNALIMIQLNVPKAVSVIMGKNITSFDQEHKDDLQKIETILQSFTTKLNTFDEYRLEVLSGNLKWSYFHTSRIFWQNNAERLIENKYEILEKLVSLLRTSEDSLTLSVAAHDLGEFMTNFRSGKKILIELGMKENLINLLDHEKAPVKYHALKTLQILMLNNHELLTEYLQELTSVKIKKL